MPEHDGRRCLKAEILGTLRFINENKIIYIFQQFFLLLAVMDKDIN